MRRIQTNTELKEVFEDVQEKMSQVRCDFPWEDREAYIGWLVQSYEYAYNSTRILALTGGKMPTDKTLFSNRFIAHAAEEKGHEKLLENDAKGFGLNIKDIEPLPEAKAFHQSLYYWLSFGNPIGMFGWVIALEGFAVKNVPQMYEVCKQAHGAKTTSFLRVHAQEDEGHLESAFKSIEGFTAEENQIVAETMIQYGYLYSQMLVKVKEGLMEKRISA